MWNESGEEGQGTLFPGNRKYLGRIVDMQVHRPPRQICQDALTFAEPLQGAPGGQMSRLWSGAFRLPRLYFSCKKPTTFRGRQAANRLILRDMSSGWYHQNRNDDSFPTPSVGRELSTYRARKVLKTVGRQVLPHGPVGGFRLKAPVLPASKAAAQRGGSHNFRAAHRWKAKALSFQNLFPNGNDKGYRARKRPTYLSSTCRAQVSWA